MKSFSVRKREFSCAKDSDVDESMMSLDKTSQYNTGNKTISKTCKNDIKFKEFFNNHANESAINETTG